MQYKMKVQNSDFIYINEIENEFQKLNEISISLDGEDWSKNVILSKKELHKFIGALLHVQSKMK